MSDPFDTSAIKQIKLISGPSIVGYVRAHSTNLGVVLIDAPMQIEKVMNEEGSLTVLLYPWLEMVEPLSSLIVPANMIVTAHALNDEGIAYYLSRVRSYAPEPQVSSAFDLSGWESAAEAN